jgi:hypothetical protein
MGEKEFSCAKGGTVFHHRCFPKKNKDCFFIRTAQDEQDICVYKGGKKDFLGFCLKD